MFAIIRTGGKQYRVVPNEIIAVEKVAGKRGQQIEFTEVLALFRDEGVKVGQPLIEGARVQATVLEQAKTSKILVFKKKRRHNYRRKTGHRQDLTVVRIDEVLGPGEEPTSKPAELKPRPMPRPTDGAKAGKAAGAPRPAARPEAKTKGPSTKVKPKKARAEVGKSEKAETKKRATKAPVASGKSTKPAAKKHIPAKSWGRAKAPRRTPDGT